MKKIITAIKNWRRGKGTTFSRPHVKYYKEREYLDLKLKSYVSYTNIHL
jgi:hypothetical protein